MEDVSVATNQKKQQKQIKRDKRKREAKEHRPTLENNFSTKQKSIGKLQLGLVVVIMVLASVFIFTQMT